MEIELIHYQDKWVMREVEGYWIRIYIAGDVSIALNTCRQFCFAYPFCVTVSATSYVYQGGLEDGVEIGIINYARFPRSSNELIDIARNLADTLLTELHQWSYTILTPDKSLFVTRREDKDNAYK